MAVRKDWERISCRLDAICSKEGQRTVDRCLDVSTNMKYGLLIGWLLQVDLNGGPYLRETHVNGCDVKHCLFKVLNRD